MKGLKSRSDKWVNPMGSTSTVQSKTLEVMKKGIEKAVKEVKKKRSKKIQTQPLTKSFLCLKYNNNNDVISSTTKYQTGTEIVYVVNALNRPLYTQTVLDVLPAGFNQLKDVFSEYKVYAAKVKLEVAPNKSNKDLDLVIQLNNYANLLRNIQNKTVDDAASGRRNTWTYKLPTDKPFVFEKYIKIHELEGISKTALSADFTQYLGQVDNSAANIATAVPARQCTFKFAIANNTDTTAADITYEMTIDYYSKFSNRKGMVQSLTVT